MAKRDHRDSRRNLAILTGIGAAAAAAVGYLLTRRLTEGGRGSDAPAMDEVRPHGWTGHSSAARSAAGPESMRDPPKSWSAVDETSDESFPASDPAPFAPKID